MSPFALGPALVAWAAVVYKLPALRRNPRDPALRAYCLGLFAAAGSLTLVLPPVYQAINRLAGFPNAARPLAHSLTLICLSALGALFLYWNYPEEAPDRIRRGNSALAGVLVVMVTLFALAPVEEEAQEFTARYAETPFAREYLLLFFIYEGIMLVYLLRLTWRYAGISDRVALSLGFRVMAAGEAFGLAYATHEVFYIAASTLNIGYAESTKITVTRLLVAIGYGLVIVGSTMPAWGPRLGLRGLREWVGQYLAYRRLRTLWLALYRSCPEIALTPPISGAAEWFAVRDLGLRLYRRVIEIRDGQLALRPYLDPAVADSAYQRGLHAGLEGKALEAMVEAATLRSALHAKTHLQRPTHRHLASDPPGGNDLESEIAFLREVARCYGKAELPYGQGSARMRAEPWPLKTVRRRRGSGRGGGGRGRRPTGPGRGWRYRRSAG